MPYICITDTVCEGRIASWKDAETGKPCVYETHEAAMRDADDPVLRQMYEENDEEYEPDTVLEVIVTDDRIYDPVNDETYWRKPV